MLNKSLLLFHTIKYLKAGQITNRIKRKLIKPKIALLNSLETSIVNNNLHPIIKHKQKMFSDNRFIFLNKEFNVLEARDWNTASQDKLWIYNLHYFDDLNAVGSKQRNPLHSKLIQKWIDENPCGFGSGWEAYPTSLRIVNWIKWSLTDGNLTQEALDSLVSQTRYLNQNLEYHLLGNHLFVNAKALIFSGLYFQGVEADEWYQKGMKILKKELPEQVLSDGGNFELSPMYHSIFLEDLLDIINLHKVYSKAQPINIVTKALQMFEWLEAMLHPDGEITFFNDATLGVAPSFIDLLHYAKRLDIIYKKNRLNDFIYLKESGYIRSNLKDIVLIADVAKIGPDYIPGHGHADALSFEMSIFDKRLFVNSGVSTYELGSERNIQRSTKSHSTISIDNKNSSQVWGGFRVAKRAKVFNIQYHREVDNIRFSACHDGYKRLIGKVIHCREWNLSENLVEIVDKINGNGSHNVRSVLPLHPEVKVKDCQDNIAELMVAGKKIKVNFTGNGLLRVEKSNYYPEFGLSIDNLQLIYSYNGELPFLTTIKISW
jgi:uncharacterized heparinase superfamily protein